MTSAPTVLDPKQLTRIESLHRGSLYQHLYGVACLLVSQGMGADSVLVETDEDIEIKLPDLRVYIQVKTRVEALHKSDISSTLARFDALRKEHVSGKRETNFRFVVVANTAPGPDLAAFVSSGHWPTDVSILWPDQGAAHGNQHPHALGLPPAFVSVEEAVSWCTAKAESIPYSRLPGDTLVWQLAALVQYASAGEPPYLLHEFRCDELPTLFEQVVLQLHEFPAIPKPYRPHEDEPVLDSNEPVQLIVGVSGSGKTAWASQAAIHSKSMVAYYDVADTLGPSLSLALARELGARWVSGNNDALSTVLLPGNSGTESLRALDLFLQGHALETLVVIDNAHRVETRYLKDVVTACKSMRFVLLAQPWAGRSELEAQLGILSVALNGWSIDTIAAELSGQGCPTTPETSSRIRELTGGLPLYVRNSADLAKRHYQGDVAAFCQACEDGLEVGVTAQEAILAQGFEGLDDVAKQAVAVLSLSTVPLEKDEALKLLGDVMGSDPPTAATRLRDLDRRGMLVLLQDGRILLHDAFRLVVINHRASMDQSLVRKAAGSLRELLMETVTQKPDPQRSRLILRLLPLTGDVKPIVDFASDEFFYEYGLFEEFNELLNDYASTDGLSPEDQFWALDAIAFSDLMHENVDSVDGILSRMEKLLPALPVDLKGNERIITKKLSVAGFRKNISEVRRIYEEAIKSCSGDNAVTQIVKYTFAVSLYRCGAYEEVEKIAFELAMEYFDDLGLEADDVFAKNTPEVVKSLGDKVNNIDSLKHLADCLDLYAITRNRRGLNSGVARLHAVKFYDIAHAVSSLVRTSQDVVDELIAISGDAEAAKKFIEDALLPTIMKYRLLGHLVPLRGQYAVVLAYCGQAGLAKKEIERLRGFKDALPEIRRLELSNQERLFGLIEQGTVRLNTRIDGPALASVGRNQPCPCGSGLKYKRCHGKR